jgi:hypothetical protein
MDYQVMPPLSAEQRAALKEAIRAANGIQVPVEEDEHGNILDGHHRVELWHELRAEGVRLPDYPRIIRPGLTEAEKRAHARSLNLARRQLTREQWRQLIADQLRDTPERSNRQIAEDLHVDHKTVGSVRQEQERRGEIPHVSTRTDSKGRQQPARRPTILCKNGMEARRASKILEAVPVEELPSRVGDVRLLAKIGRQHRLDNMPDVPAVQTIGDASLRVGSLLDALADVPYRTVDLILTDPPYGPKFLSVFDDLSLLAARLLKDDGVLVSYTGAFDLPLVMASLGKHLDWHWLLHLIHGYGGDTCINSRFINQRGKPILMYTKRGCHRRPRWLQDVIRGDGPEKSDHRWQQAEGEFALLIELLTDPGDLVVDPFLGAGTTAAAAVKLGRKFIGCDIDAGALAIARERVAKCVQKAG